MSEQSIPIGLNGLQNYITLTSTLQQVFSYEMNNGRIMGIIYYNDHCLGGYDLAVVEGNATNLKNYGKFTNSELSDLPVWYRLKPEFDFDINFEYINNKLYAKINSDSGDKLILIRGLFFSGSGYIGSNVYSMDYIMENTTGSNVQLLSPLITHYPFVSNSTTTLNSTVTMNGGDINIGTTTTNNSINIGTNYDTGRIVTIGSTGSGSSIVLKGGIDIQNTIDSTVVFNNPTNGTWTDVSSTAKRVGNICCIKIKATITPTLSNTLASDTKHNFFTINDSSFISSNAITGVCSIEEGSNVVSAIVVNEPGSNVFKIVFSSTIGLSVTKTVNCSITYIK